MSEDNKTPQAPDQKIEPVPSPIQEAAATPPRKPVFVDNDLIYPLRKAWEGQPEPKKIEESQKGTIERNKPPEQKS